MSKLGILARFVQAMRGGGAPPSDEIYAKSFIDRFIVATGKDFTPAELQGYITRAVAGDMRWLLAFYDEMRARDPHLEAELAKATRAISGARFDLLPYPATVRAHSQANTAEAAIAAEVTAYLQEQLFSPDVRLDRVVATLCTGFWKGVAGLEVHTAVNAAGVESLVSITEIPAQRFRYFPGTTDLALQTTGDQSHLEPVEKYMVDGRLVLFLPDGANPNPARMGLLRRIIAPWIGRNHGFKWWSLYVQLFGIPFRVGTYQTESDKTALVTALQNAGTAGWAALPEGNKLEFVKGMMSSGASASEHERFLDFCAREISKTINGSTQTTDVQKGAGSRATSGVHQDEKRELASARAAEIAAVIRSQIMRPLVSRRFGEDVAARFTSELRIRVDEEEDLLSFSQALKNFKDAGVNSIPVSYFHDRGGVPVPDPGEPTIGGDAEPDDAMDEGAEPVPDVETTPGEAGRDEAEEAAVVAAAAHILRFRAARRRTPAAAARSAARVTAELDRTAARVAPGSGEPLLARYVTLIEQTKRDGGDLLHLLNRVDLASRTFNDGQQATADVIAAVIAEATKQGFTMERRAEGGS